MPRDQLASLSHWSSAPGVTPAPCQRLGVSPVKTSQTLGSPSAGMDRAVAGVLPAAGTDAANTKAATDPKTNREKVNIATPPSRAVTWQRKRHLLGTYPDLRGVIEDCRPQFWVKRRLACRRGVPAFGSARGGRGRQHGPPRSATPTRRSGDARPRRTRRRLHRPTGPWPVGRESA